MASVYKRKIRGKASKYYYADYLNQDGVRVKKSTGCSDKQSATRIANKWESESQLIREGVVDLGQLKLKNEKLKPIDQQVEDFKNHLIAKKCNDQHVSEVITRIHKVLKYCKYTSIVDISIDGINLYVAKLEREHFSAQTMGKYIGSMKQFTKWLTETEKLNKNPLHTLRKPNPAKDRRIERRMLLVEEWNYIQENLHRTKFRFNMPPEERVLLYGTALQTGYRSNELRQLTIGAFENINTKIVLVLKTSDTKNSKRSAQYITNDLANRLKTLCKKKRQKDKIFSMPSRTNVSKMFEDDLTDLRSLWINDSSDDEEKFKRKGADFLCKKNHLGEVADFHALRHTCGAWLAISGVHPKVIQTILRHSSITLTMDTYGHLFPQQEAEAVLDMWNKLEKQSADSSQISTLKVLQE